MSETRTTFVDWLAGRLAEAGLRWAFGVPGGGGSLDLLDALRARKVDTVITAREDAAVIMAGVSGVLAGGPGLAFTTKGPGLANATNGLASAALDRMPALLVSEAFEKSELEFLSHQVYSQEDLVAPLLQRSGGGTLAARQDTVEDWLNHESYAPAVMFPSSSDFVRLVPAKAKPAKPAMAAAAESPDLDRAAALLRTSRRPVIVVGLDAARPAVTPELRAFVDRLGALALCTYMAKGCIRDDDPHYAGIFTGGALEQACVGAADLIVLVGLDPIELIRKPWPYQAPVLDLCARVHEPHYVAPAQRVVGPLSASLRGLTRVVGGSDWSGPEIATFRQGFFAGMEAGGASALSSAHVVKAVREAFAGQPRLSVDAGAHMFSACAFWPGREARDVLISNGLATMGFALPAAIAAALDAPERGAIAMTGDGGLLMCLGELKTAVELGANLTIIVFNDGRLSLIDIKRQDRQMPDLGLSWTPPDFAAVARGFGINAWRVDTAAELESSLAAAATAGGPRLLDICIDAGGYRDQLRALRG
jgi:acetolactate synthase-1/2/3 large subunit